VCQTHDLDGVQRNAATSLDTIIAFEEAAKIGDAKFGEKRIITSIISIVISYCFCPLFFFFPNSLLNLRLSLISLN